MSTKMDEDDWAHTLAVFRACLPRRGRKAEDDRRFPRGAAFLHCRERSLARSAGALRSLEQRVETLRSLEQGWRLRGVLRHARVDELDGASYSDVRLPIPMNPPVCNGMIAPRDSWMMPPPCNEMIPPGAPRLLALEVLSPYGGSVKPSWTACRERGGGSRRSTRCDERCGGGGPGWRPRRWGPQQRHARRTGEAER